MVSINNLKIGKRFTMVFLAVIVITAGGLSFIMINMRTQKAAVDSIYRVRLVGIEKLIEADRDAYQSSVAISQLINAGLTNTATAEISGQLRKEIKENIDQNKERFDSFAGLYLSTGAKKSVEFATMEAQYALWKEHTGRIEESLGRNDYRQALALYNSVYRDSFSQVRDAMDKLTDRSLKLTEEEYVTFNGEYLRNLIASVLVAFLVIGFLVVSGIVLTRSITSPVNQAIVFSDKLARGDFTGRIHVDQEDEIGVMMKSLNTAADDLEQLIAIIIHAIENLTDAVNQISEGNQSLSQRTAEQAASLEEIASTIEQATAAIIQTAENSMNAKRLTDQGAEKSDEGNRIAAQAVDAINVMNDSSKKIAEIISVINEIAFQTNLLALNAAVEAARAGEQGRGFAVVAGEVRNLAQRTASSSGEIESLIKDAIQKVERGTGLVRQSGEALASISEATRTSAGIINEIAAASQEQKNGINQINTAINEMDTMTQQNASLVEETAAASETLAVQARELKELVSRFKISRTPAAEQGAITARVKSSAPARTAPAASSRPKQETKLKKEPKPELKQKQELKSELKQKQEPKSEQKPKQDQGTGGASLRDIMSSEGFQEF